MMIYTEKDYEITDKGFRMLRSQRFLELAQQRFVAFDLETTGLKAEAAGITEIGAIRVVNGRETERFQRFVNPCMPIPDNVVRLTGITQDMVANAPTIAQVLPEFMNFLGNDPYVAHNASFDIGFLEWHGKQHGLSISPYYADSLDFARRYWPTVRSHKLGDMALLIGFEMGRAHRSMADTEALVALVLASIERWKRTGSDRSVEDLITQEHMRFLRGIPCSPPSSMQGLDNLERVLSVLRRAWSRNTCETGLAAWWTPEDPSLGQDDVTVRLVAHLCGAKIARVRFRYGRQGLMNFHDGRLLTLCGPQPGCVTGVDVDELFNAEDLCRDGNARLRFRQLQKNILDLLAAKEGSP